MENRLNAVEVRGLKKIYQQKNKKGVKVKEALKSIDIDIPSGSFFGLLGPNGAGKSTFINILAGLVNKTEGLVKISGYDIDTHNIEAKSSLGVVPQELILDPFFTVREMLDLYAGYYGIKKEQRKTEEIIRALGLEDKADAKPRRLSGGMRRRLLVAKALVHSPKVLILDEPTAGVDIELRNQLWNYVLELNRAGTTIVLTTHYLEEAQELCDHIAIIDKGAILKVDRKENLLKTLDNKQFIVHFENQITELPKEIEQFEYELIKGHGIIIKYNQSEHPAEKIISIIKSMNLTIKDISTKEADLEDVFRYIIAEKA